MDTDHRTDKVWVLGIQRKLYQWSKANPDDQWRDMWGWLTDLRVLRHAWQRGASNKGRRTAGVDGMTVGRIRNRSEHRFLVDLQADLRSGAYRPSPAGVWIAGGGNGREICSGRLPDQDNRTDAVAGIDE